MRGEVTVRRASALQGGPELQAHPHPCSVVSSRRSPAPSAAWTWGSVSASLRGLLGGPVCPFRPVPSPLHSLPKWDGSRLLGRPVHTTLQPVPASGGLRSQDRAGLQCPRRREPVGHPVRAPACAEAVACGAVVGDMVLPADWTPRFWEAVITLGGLQS